MGKIMKNIINCIYCNLLVFATKKFRGKVILFDNKKKLTSLDLLLDALLKFILVLELIMPLSLPGLSSLLWALQL